MPALMLLFPCISNADNFSQKDVLKTSSRTQNLYIKFIGDREFV